MTKEFFPKGTGKQQKILKITPPYGSERASVSSGALTDICFDELFPPLPDSSSLLVGTGREDFMASRIAHAVEDADANLLNMNVTRLDDDFNKHIIHLRVNHRNPERVARSLERYGYNILSLSEEGMDFQELADRHNELMHYLSI